MPYARDFFVFIESQSLPDNGRGPGKISYSVPLLPKRAGDGSIRGIDPLFVANGISMVQSIGEGSLYKTTIHRFPEVSAKAFNTIAASLHAIKMAVSSTVYYGVCNDIGQGLYIAETTSADAFNEIPGALIEQKEWECDEGEFGKGKPIRRSTVEALYRDYSYAVKRVFAKSEINAFGTEDKDGNEVLESRGFIESSLTHEFNGGKGSYDPGGIDDWRLLYNYAAHAKSVQDDETWYEYYDSIETIRVEFLVNAPGGVEIPESATPKSAKIVLFAYATGNDSDDSEWGEEKCYSVVLDAYKSDNGSFIAEDGQIEEIVDEIVSDFGFEPIDATLPGDRRKTFSIGIRSSCVCVMEPADGYVLERQDDDIV